MEIPLFPLPNLVLFPQVKLPLHIFEERYKLMVNQALEANSAFGMTLLGHPTRESEETIQRVGVTVRVMGTQRFDDGRMDILTVGESRFRILEFTGRQPYWTAEVEFFEDSEEPLPLLQASYDKVSSLFRRVVDLMRKARGEAPDDRPLPESPLGLSYMVSHLLGLPAVEKQRLLELTSTSERLNALALHLEPLAKALVRKAGSRKAGSNGQIINNQ